MIRRRNHRLLILLCVLGLFGAGTGLPPAASAPPLEDCTHATEDRCEKWATVHDDPDGHYSDPLPHTGASDYLRAMAVSPTGDRVFTLGYMVHERTIYTGLIGSPSIGPIAPEEYEPRWALVATDARFGDPLWVTQLPQPWNWVLDRSSMYANAIALSPDGRRAYVSGTMAFPERPGDPYPLQNRQIMTMAFDTATGERLWQESYSGAPVGHRDGEAFDLHSNDEVADVVAAPDSDKVFVVGTSDTNTGFYDIVVVAYEGSSGKRLWTATHDTSTPEHPYAADKARLAGVSPDGQTAYVVGGGRVLPTGTSAPTLLAYRPPVGPDGKGRLIWERSLGNVQADSLHVAPDGSRLYIRQGTRISAFSSATGQSLWATNYPGTIPYSSESYRFVQSPVAVGPNGGPVFVTGSIGGAVGTVALDAATGGKLWEARYDPRGPASTQPAYGRAVIASPDGERVYVTGYDARVTPGTDMQAEGDAATVALDAATGDLRWVAGRPLVATDSFTPFLVDVAPDGTVFISGDLGRVDPHPRTDPEPATRDNVGDWEIRAYEP